MNQINEFEWEGDEKEQFVKEITELKPKEREDIIREMVNKSD